MDLNHSSAINKHYLNNLFARIMLTIMGLSLLSIELCGQTVLEKLILTKESDTTFWRTYYMHEFKRLDLINQNDNIDFLRVGSSKDILELSDKTNRVVFYADEIWEDRQTEHSFSKSFELDPKQVTEIEQLIDSLDISSIPSDRFIKGWSSGFDGITYFIEKKKGDLYSFKTYWTPSALLDLKEAKVLSDFADKRLDRIIDYDGKRKLFEQEIPFYGWAYNGSIITTEVIADRKAFRKYKREKKKQLKQ